MAALLRSVGVPEALEDTFTMMRQMVKDLVAPIDAGMLIPLNDGAALRAGDAPTPRMALPATRPAISRSPRDAPCSAAITYWPTSHRTRSSKRIPTHHRADARASWNISRASIDSLSSTPKSCSPGTDRRLPIFPFSCRTCGAITTTGAGLILELITSAPDLTIYELAERFFSGLTVTTSSSGCRRSPPTSTCWRPRGQVLATGQPQRFVAT